VCDVDADAVIQEHAAEMRRRTGARGAKLHMRLVRFGIGNKFFEIIGRQVLARDQHDRNFSSENYRREIGHGIVKRMLVSRLTLGVRVDVAEHELIAIRRGFSDTLRTGHPER
jgi:hypothetical protein